MGGEVRRESEMASKMGVLLAGEDAKDMRQVFAAAIAGDEAIFGSPVLRSGEGGATTPFDGDIMAMLKNDGNRQMLAGFLGQWDPAAAWVADNVSQEQQMNIICQQEPALVQASLITDGGEAGLDALSAGLAAEGSITIGGYAGGLDGAGIHTRPGMANDPGDIGTGEVASTMGLVSEELTLGEHHIYGAQRLGIRYYDGNTGADGTVAHSTGVTNEGTGLRNVWVYGDAGHSYYNLNNRQAWYSYGYGDMVKATVAAYTNGWNGWADPVNGAHVNGWEPTALVNGYMAGRTLGWTHYEITDHLGDVLATILDRKTGAATSHSANYNYGYEAITGVGNTGVLTLNTYAQTGVAAYDYFRADVVTATDVYPFGMPMVERTYEASSGLGLMGRYGFNGQMLDNQIAGLGNSIDFKYRGFDPRIARFKSVDPLTANYPWNSTYAFAENTPIQGMELEGSELTLPRIGSWQVPEPFLTLPKVPTMPVQPMPPIPPAIPQIPFLPKIPSVPSMPHMPIAPQMKMQEIDWENPPATPNDLPAGWSETTDSRNTSGRNRSFKNDKSGDEIRFDKSDPTRGGDQADDHWHRLNPNREKSMGNKLQYLDKFGNPVDKNSGPSH